MPETLESLVAKGHIEHRHVIDLGRLLDEKMPSPEAIEAGLISGIVKTKLGPKRARPAFQESGKLPYAIHTNFINQLKAYLKKHG